MPIIKSGAESNSLQMQREGFRSAMVCQQRFGRAGQCRVMNTAKARTGVARNWTEVKSFLL